MMRRGFSGTGLVVAGLVTFWGTAGAASAQEEGQGKYVAQASTRLVALVNQANRDGFKLHDNKLSIGGGWLKKGSEWVTIFPVVLEKDKAYRFLAAGDDDASDVDLQIVDANGKEVKADTKTDPTAVVDFTPDSTQQYQIRVRVFSSAGDVPCVCLGIILAK